MMIPKFRAWHMPFGPKGPMQEMVHGKASSILAFAEMSPDKYIVEQFTGMKDVYGEEIYEGDMVHWRDSSYIGADVIGKVYFGQGTFRIQPNNQKKMNPPCKDRSISLYDVDPDDLEIIGDIHTGGTNDD